MYYLKTNYKDGLDIKEIYIEVDCNGRVTREIQFDNSNNVIHKCPAEGFKYGTYGLFDNVSFDIKNLKSDLAKEEFEKLWNSELEN